MPDESNLARELPAKNAIKAGGIKKVEHATIQAAKINGLKLGRKKNRSEGRMEIGTAPASGTPGNQV